MGLAHPNLLWQLQIEDENTKQTAELELDSSLALEASLTGIEIDTKETQFRAQSGVDGKLPVLELLPGWHSIKATFREVGSGTSGFSTISFTAVAHGKYKLVSAAGTASRVRIEDVSPFLNLNPGR